jgi:hypothetical protein
MIKEAIIFFGSLFAGLAVLMFGLFLFANHMAEGECRRTAAAMGVEVRYEWNVPCLIKPEGKPWVPLKSYRVF